MALILTYSISSAAALDGVILNPRHTSVTQRILSYKSYDDIRIDKDLDGSIDEWFLKKADIQIHLIYKMKALQALEITKFIGNRVLIKKFESINGKLLLTSREDRPMQIMHGTPDEEICDEKGLSSSLQSKVSSLNQDIAAIIARPEVNSAPKSCNINKYPVFAENLGLMGDLLSSNTGKIASCLEKVKKVNDIDLNLVSAKFKLTVEKISNGDSKDIYSCQLTDQNNVAGEATEDGRIKFLIPSEKQDPVIEPEAMVSLFLHEILHTSGIKSDQTNNFILKLCLSEDWDKMGANNIAVITNQAVQKSVDDYASQESANTKSTKSGRAISASKKTKREIASATESLGADVDMKSEIANAESVVPSAEKLTVAKIDKSPAGKEQALRDSVQESAPVFRMANQVMGASNTPALADTSSGSSSSEVGGSSSSRGRYQSRYGRYQSDSSSGGGVGKDEFIAEEIDLTKNQNGRNERSGSNTRSLQRSYQVETPSTASSQSENSNSRGPASVSNEIGGAGSRRGGAVDGGGNVAVGGSTGSASLSMDTSSVGGGGGGSASSRNTQKGRSANTASRGPASTGNKGSPAERRELMSSLVDSDYTLTRRKLKDPGFQTKLSDNQITVIDVNGNRWGASRGALIYLDDGSRFIRQR
ncbi:hypothetical protein B9G69_007800 [Bdellovibrio sp. SKB1291214]|uniref:hypothetical protein n=1 Tax=Bdellovibrio sp. SKB1291214 TaxID=1732569 RepID=UPI000B516755|nr:hypothetical protein [Bdellovibrio sp. SKB1291214]UYL10479.1 hypothetical protein B9G69_007800 [Bdellovibrio sp. SKB1291214]